MNVYDEGKVVPVPSKEPRHDIICGTGGIAPCTRNLATVWGVLPASHPSTITSEHRASDSGCTGGCIDPIAVPLPGFEPQSSSP
jgi:hypothetical protein